MDFVSTTTLTQFAQSTLCLHSQHCVYTVHTVSTQSTLCLHSQHCVYTVNDNVDTLLKFVYFQTIRLSKML